MEHVDRALRVLAGQPVPDHRSVATQDQPATSCPRQASLPHALPTGVHQQATHPVPAQLPPQRSELQQQQQQQQPLAQQGSLLPVAAEQQRVQQPSQQQLDPAQDMQAQHEPHFEPDFRLLSAQATGPSEEGPMDIDQGNHHSLSTQLQVHGQMPAAMSSHEALLHVYQRMQSMRHHDLRLQLPPQDTYNMLVQMQLSLADMVDPGFAMQPIFLSTGDTAMSDAFDAADTLMPDCC